MSVTGPAQSAVDWVNPVNWARGGHWQGHWGWGQASHVGGRRRRNSGDQNRGGPSPELAGIALRGSGRNGARPIRKNSQRRIQWWPGLRRTWPESAPASGGGGGTHGCPTETRLRRAIEQAEGLGGIYARWGVQRA